MGKSKFKIGLVLDDTLDTPDGVQQYVLAVGQWLGRQGHDVHYLVGETHRSDITNVHSLSRNVKVRYNGNRLSIPLPASPRKLRALLVAEAFDVLHVQMPYSPMLAARIIKSASAATVIVGTFHVLPYSRATRLGNRALSVSLRRSLKRFDQVFAVTQAAQKFAERTYGIESNVLPNVVDLARFHGAEPLPKYTNKTLTIMFLGRLVPRKGAKTLLEAAEILKTHPDLPQFRVVICGKGPLAAELKKYARAHYLEDLVTFTGFVPEADKPRYVASADIMVFPSSSGESFGIVLIEAFGGGALVLAGDNPGYRSVLAPKPELLFPPGKAHVLADKLAYYLRHPDAARRIIEWERLYVRQFDVAAVGTRLVETYAQQLQKKRGH